MIYSFITALPTVLSIRTTALKIMKKVLVLNDEKSIHSNTILSLFMESVAMIL